MKRVVVLPVKIEVLVTFIVFSLCQSVTDAEIELKKPAAVGQKIDILRLFQFCFSIGYSMVRDRG